MSRDYVNESYRDALRQSKLLQGVEFICASYDEVNYIENSIIYVDPPYANTTKYKIKFNHNKFWNWVRKMSKQGYKVFVSEYNAPEDFFCIWQKELDVGLAHLNGKDGNKKKIERLFVYRNFLKF
jgi:DNA adenine methylase